MKRWLSIAALAVAAATTCGAAELITLRNGFQLQCDHHRMIDGHVRLFLTAGGNNFMDLLPSEIAGFASAADPAISPLAEPSRPPNPQSSALSVTPELAAPAVISPADLNEMLARAGHRHNLDVDLLASVVHAESGGNPQAVSRAGARGLMQLMPSTAASLGVENSFQPQENVRGGSAYLDELLTRYGDNLALALAAYNAGPEAVDRFGGIPPYAETRAYVARVIHEYNRRIWAREAVQRNVAGDPVLPRKLHRDVSQK
jgi:soluble lytic murein transglycosylase-like protein